MYVYPDGSADKKYLLLARRGDFWKNSHGDFELAADIFQARAAEEQQTQQDMLELYSLLSRYTAPVWHTDLHYCWKIKRSELTSTPLLYGDGYNYGDPIVYGQTIPNSWLRVELPPDLVSCEQIVDSPVHERVAWLDRLDYRIDGRFIYFAVTPAAAAFRQDPLPDTEDATITLWLRNARFDRRYLYQWYGYLLGLEQTSSETYKQFINTVLDCYLYGSSYTLLSRLLGLLVGTPTALSEETVLHSTSDAWGRLVITDRNVYRGPASAAATVAIGDSLEPGQPIFDALRWYNLAAGETPDVEFLQLDRDLLSERYAGGLTFANSELPLSLTYDETGRAKVSFPLTGLANDVKLFFDELHAKALAAATYTLAELLDIRGLTKYSPVELLAGVATQPTLASLPATINPCQFLVQNVLRFNFKLARIKLASSQGGLNWSASAILRKVLPPWFNLLLQFDLPPFSTTVADSRYTESLSPYSAAESLTDTMLGTACDESLRIYYVESPCE